MQNRLDQRWPEHKAYTFLGNFCMPVRHVRRSIASGKICVGNFEIQEIAFARYLVYRA